MTRWKALLCSAMMCVASINAVAPQPVCAEETPKHEAMYEFPFTAEMYITHSGTGEYHEIDMRCQVNIELNGDTSFTFIVDEDFTYINNSEVVIINGSVASGKQSEITLKTNRDFITDMKYPNGSIMKQFDDLYAKYYTVTNRPKENRRINGEWGNGQWAVVPAAQPQYEGGFIDFYNPDTHFCFHWNIWVSFFRNESGEYEDEIFSIKKGDIVGEYVGHSYSTIYTDEQGKHFVLDDGNKNYFHDIVSITVNGTTISKEIGDNWANTPAVIYKQADVDDNQVVDIADAVMLRKWLTSEVNALPCWQAADMNGDGKLNAVDLTLLKRQLLSEKK